MRKQPLSLFGSRQLSSLKLIISTKPDSGIPYNIILPHPPKEDTEPFTFLVDKPPALQFDIFPTFGTKVIARGVCLPTVLEQILREGRGDGSTAPERCVVPLVDTHLRVLGELCFEVSAVTPFKHSGVEIGGKVETYWKSTRVVTATGRRPSEGNQDVPPTPAEEKANFGTLVQTLGRGEPASVVQSFVTASSLAEEYVVLAVQLTRDGVPVVCSDWTVPLAPGIALQLAELTAEQFSALPRDTAVSTADDEGEEEKAAARLPALGDPNAALGTRSSPDLAKMVYASRATLAQVLAILPQSVGVNILIRYPTDSEKAYLGLTDRHDVNTVVDAVLKVVYDSAADSQRSIIFSSFNPAVCTAGNWKQPNYAVFFCTHAGYRYMPSERPPGSNVPQPLPYGKRGKKDKGKKGKKKKAKGKKKGKGKAGEDPADAPGSEPEDAGADEEEIHEADDRCTSIKEAIRFAKSANLLGIVCDARPLVQVPSLIGTIKEGGLLLATFGEANADPENVRLQESCGVDAIMVDNVFKYNVTS
ncbi:PLC-like phosphodiesterase [Hyaloraphidium curvatum]|nr:PLC-like phosphodiesterase [Hyaloraphidium curvatum]